MRTETVIRHGTGARIHVRSDVPGMVAPIVKGVVRISVGISPIAITPKESAALAKSA